MTPDDEATSAQNEAERALTASGSDIGPAIRAEHRERLRSIVIAESRRGRLKSPGRHLVAWIAAAAVLLVAGGAVLLSVRRETSAPIAVGCYASDEALGSSSTAPATILLDSTEDLAQAAVTACADAWATGRVSGPAGTGSQSPGGPSPSYPVPALTACVLTDGSVGVLPGDRAVCASLGLRSVDR